MCSTGDRVRGSHLEIEVSGGYFGVLDTRFNKGQHVLLSKIITDNKFFSLWCFPMFRHVLVYHRITITYSGTGTALMDPEQNQSYSLSQWRMRNKDTNTP